jgi:hypothetical protein
MTGKRVNNSFSNLKFNDAMDDADHTDSAGKDAEYRKAVKKLREIHNIRERSAAAIAAGKDANAQLTKEQQEKISREAEWWKIINLYDNPNMTTAEPLEATSSKPAKSNRKLEKERKARDKKEMAKREEARRAELKREYDERCKKQAEQFFKRIQEEREAQHNKKNVYEAKEDEDFSKIQDDKKIQNEIHTEYMTLYEKNKNAKKTFHLLSKKYHPDMNIGNEDWANKRFQFLSNIYNPDNPEY